jgi:hypothetical protein
VVVVVVSTVPGSQARRRPSGIAAANAPTTMVARSKITATPSASAVGPAM